MQLVEPLTDGSACEVAVTRTLSLALFSALADMVTVSVAVPEAPATSGKGVEGERLSDQPALSAVVREYVSETLPVFVTVTV